MKTPGVYKALSILSLTLLPMALYACGDAESDQAYERGMGDESGNPMETLALAVEPCTATFREDYQIPGNPYGYTGLTIKAGDTLIMGSLYDYRNGNLEAGLYYLVDKGAHHFRVKIEGEDQHDFPFDSSCGFNNTESYVGVFNDVVVYADQTCTQEVCSLSRGDSVKNTTGFGFTLVSDPALGPAIYSMNLSSFSEVCDGLTTGYVKATNVSALGQTLIPIGRYLALLGLSGQ